MDDKNANIDYQKELKPKENIDNKQNNQQNNNIINNFPNWDLLPPYQTVRRITRK